MTRRIMHPRNRFRDKKPDFGLYSKTCQSLEPYLIKRKHCSSEGFQYTLNFSDPDALRELTCACLKYEFGLNVHIPPCHLVPAVPQRLNYIHWVEDLLSRANVDGDFPKGGDVIGIDIGTGASCIYPLLSTKLNGWTFIATELQEDSWKCAVENVCRNNLQDKITVQLVTSADLILFGVVQNDVPYSFCMCNPPFFKDKDDKLGTASRTGNRPIPLTQNTGNESETITDGGEVAFVKRIISDSLKLGTKIKWYTSMLGKKASVRSIKSELLRNKVPVVVSTEFSQGKTHRWAIGWSFDPDLKDKAIQLTSSSPGKRPKPLTTPLKGFPSSMEGIHQAVACIKKIFEELKIEYKVIPDEENTSGVCLQCETRINTWSNQRKRRRLMERLQEIKDKPEITYCSPQLTTYQENSKLEFAVDDKNLSDTPQESIDRSLASDFNVSRETVSLNINQESLTDTKKKLHFTEEQIVDELQSLNVPCCITFRCFFTFIEDEEWKTKKKSLFVGIQMGDNVTSDHILFGMEWMKGDNRDTLHQIMQLILNKLS